MTKDVHVQKKIGFFFIATILFFYTVSFCLQSPAEILKGYIDIILSRDALITDYFVVGGMGAAFFNVALVMTLGFCLITYFKLPYTGITFAVMFMLGGYSLFGKNIINILPIILGSYLYAKMQGVRFARYLYVSLYATCLSPIVTELVYLLPYSKPVNLMAAALAGILIGFILPSLSAHTVSMHMGYNLFNVGFAAGLLGFIIVCVLKSFELFSTQVLLWQEGRPRFLIFLFYGYFIFTFLYGFFLSGKKLKPLLHLWRHPGRAIADFVLMDGVGPTFMNMGLMGICCFTYILCIKGDLSGPVLGAILSTFGFAAFGAHIRNYLPVLAGVYLSTYLKIFTPVLPGIQLAAIFSAGISPICGQFGIIAGLFAGMLHTSIVMCTSDMYSGLNLYNNGFSCGFVAIIMVPVMESFIKRFQQK